MRKFFNYLQYSELSFTILLNLFCIGLTVFMLITEIVYPILYFIIFVFILYWFMTIKTYFKDRKHE